jgi:hypothetical protein
VDNLYARGGSYFSYRASAGGVGEGIGGCSMDRFWAKIVVITVLALGVALVSSGVSQAKSQGADLAVTGVVAGGETSTESFHLIVFVFTLTNKGPLATDGSADLTLTDVQGGSIVDVMCVLPNGFGINPDFPSCETGPLNAKQSVHDTYVVQPSGTSTSVSLRACVSNEGSVPDPVSGNDCRTLAVAIV